MLEVVVGADLLDQLVVDAEKGDEDADDLEGLGAEPGSVALRVLSGGLAQLILRAALSSALEFWI